MPQGAPEPGIGKIGVTATEAGGDKVDLATREAFKPEVDGAVPGPSRCRVSLAAGGRPGSHGLRPTADHMMDDCARCPSPVPGAILDPDQPRLDQVRAVEETRHLLAARGRYCCWMVPLHTSAMPPAVSPGERSDPRWETAR